MNKRVLSLLLALTLCLGLALPAFAQEDRSAAAELAPTLERAAAFLRSAVTDPQVGSIGGEWTVLGLARGGFLTDAPDGQSYLDRYYAQVESCVQEQNGVLHDKKYTEYSRVVLALTAIGADPSNVGGYDLLAPLDDFDKTVWQGINGPIWALIALDSGSYESALRQRYIDEILSRQLAGGGWDLQSRGGDRPADPDVTGMALQALAPYRGQSAVSAAIDKALARMSAQQDQDGGFSSFEDPNVESCVQMTVALCALGLDPGRDPRFVKNGASLLDALLSYRLSDGSFAHTKGRGFDLMATEQALCALAAVDRYYAGWSGLYRMDDVTLHVSGQGARAPGLPGKSGAVRVMPVIDPAKTFPDIADHPSRAAIEALAQRSIINGKDGGVFDPGGSMTRCEFAAIVTRALGLELSTPAVPTYADLPAGHWAYRNVETATALGILRGDGKGAFLPMGTLTRQEAAVMLARCAELCGIDGQMDAAAIRDVLAQFGDYVKTPDWARSGLALCYREGILDDADLNINGSQTVTRAQVAQMVYQLLRAAKLL